MAATTRARNAILAASIADSVRIAGPLATMAREQVARVIRSRERRSSGPVASAPREGDRDALRVARTIAEDRDDQIDVRERAIRVIGEDDDGSAYLRSLYPRLDERNAARASRAGRRRERREGRHGMGPRHRARPRRADVDPRAGRVACSARRAIRAAFASCTTSWTNRRFASA